MRDARRGYDATFRTSCLCLLVCLAATPARPQHRPGDPPQGSAERTASQGDVGRYEMMYGSPEFHSLDAEFDPWPNRQAIRTVGRVSPIPGRQRGRAPLPSGSSGPMAPRWDNAFARYQICGERVCVAIVPVWEVREAFESMASGASGQALEVVGAVDELKLEGQQPPYPTAFQVWKASEALATTKREGVPGNTLEPLVRYPKGAEGRVVTVSGTFRGANLFDDLPADSRRSEDDWVLRDGPFSIWIIGRDPKGKGFSLDARSKADCRFRLEVQGSVQIANDYIYLRAKKIQLLGRAASE